VLDSGKRGRMRDSDSCKLCLQTATLQVNCSDMFQKYYVSDCRLERAIGGYSTDSNPNAPTESHRKRKLDYFRVARDSGEIAMRPN